MILKCEENKKDTACPTGLEEGTRRAGGAPRVQGQEGVAAMVRSEAAPSLRCRFGQRCGGRAIPCNLKREGGQSLVI